MATESAKPKVYVKTDYVPFGTRCLTAGKVYELSPGVFGSDGCIYDDVGDRKYLFLPQCSHLNDRPWTICDADGNALPGDAT